MSLVSFQKKKKELRILGTTFIKWQYVRGSEGIMFTQHPNSKHL